MEAISVFDMLKIGIGPSSSHTLGPWRACLRWIDELKAKKIFDNIVAIEVNIYGSLALTGKGHATDTAILLGLSGYDYQTMDTLLIDKIVSEIKTSKKLFLNAEKSIDFDFEKAIVFKREFLPFHANGIRFKAILSSEKTVAATFYSIGGGFVIKENRKRAKVKADKFKTFPFQIQTGEQLLNYCKQENKTISEIVLANELSIHSDKEIDSGLQSIWNTMLECMYIGCHTEGTLPGGLKVKRRAFEMHQILKADINYNNPKEWLQSIRKTKIEFRKILKWVNCFAISVNEVNAAMGRVVTAPTNGSAGVIPAVLMYYLVIENHNATFEHIKKFLLVASEIGSIFKKGATISAAMGGCQAEIGVSSAMAAGALTELLGGTPENVLMAAEIAMEHHLGLTCDPVGGLVQIPCIERNTMGAIKAINAAELALSSDPKEAKVSLDGVVNTMWETAKDMNSKYKETSEGGLAVEVFFSDC